jgi:hypothetical protein
VNDESSDEIKRGPKGGKKHQPGRGHDKKSGKSKKGKYRKAAIKKRKQEDALLRRQWQEWRSLPPFVQRQRPELKPDKHPADE